MPYEAGKRTKIAFAEMLGVIKGSCLDLTANKLLYNKGSGSLSSFLQNTKYSAVTIKPNHPAAKCIVCMWYRGHHVCPLPSNPSPSAVGK